MSELPHRSCSSAATCGQHAAAASLHAWDHSARRAPGQPPQTHALSSGSRLRCRMHIASDTFWRDTHISTSRVPHHKQHGWPRSPQHGRREPQHAYSGSSRFHQLRRRLPGCGVARRWAPVLCHSCAAGGCTAATGRCVQKCDTEGDMCSAHPHIKQPNTHVFLFVQASVRSRR